MVLMCSFCIGLYDKFGKEGRNYNIIIYKCLMKYLILLLIFDNLYLFMENRKVNLCCCVESWID